MDDDTSAETPDAAPPEEPTSAPADETAATPAEATSPPPAEPAADVPPVESAATPSTEPPAPAPATTTATGRPRRRARSAFASVAIVVGCIFALLGGIATWTSNFLLNTDRYVATVTPLAENDAIRESVATTISTQLIQSVDLQDRVKAALPDKAGFLAAPLTAQVQSLVRTGALKLLDTPQFQKLWVEANRRAHDQVDNALTGEGKVVNTKNGKVTLDLSSLVVALRAKIADSGISVFDKVPIGKLATTYELVDLKSLGQAQAGVRVLKKLQIALPILAILAFALGVFLSRDRWKGLRWTFFGLAITAALLLATIFGARQYLANQAPTAEKQAAREATVGILAHRLIVGAVILFAIGLVLGLLTLAWTHLRRLKSDPPSPTPTDPPVAAA